MLDASVPLFVSEDISSKNQSHFATRTTAIILPAVDRLVARLEAALGLAPPEALARFEDALHRLKLLVTAFARREQPTAIVEKLYRPVGSPNWLVWWSLWLDAGASQGSGS